MPAGGPAWGCLFAQPFVRLNIIDGASVSSDFIDRTCQCLGEFLVDEVSTTFLDEQERSHLYWYMRNRGTGPSPVCLLLTCDVKQHLRGGTAHFVHYEQWLFGLFHATNGAEWLCPLKRLSDLDTTTRWSCLEDALEAVQECRSRGDLPPVTVPGNNLGCKTTAQCVEAWRNTFQLAPRASAATAPPELRWSDQFACDTLVEQLSRPAPVTASLLYQSTAPAEQRRPAATPPHLLDPSQPSNASPSNEDTSIQLRWSNQFDCDDLVEQLCGASSDAAQPPPTGRPSTDSAHESEAESRRTSLAKRAGADDGLPTLEPCAMAFAAEGCRAGDAALPGRRQRGGDGEALGAWTQLRRSLDSSHRQLRASFSGSIRPLREYLQKINHPGDPPDRLPQVAEDGDDGTAHDSRV